MLAHFAGLFAKLSALELRSQAAVCSGECSTYACLKVGTCNSQGAGTGLCTGQLCARH